MNKSYRAIVVLAIACLGCLQVHAGQKLRVFFMGNSYTHYNNMPQMVADIAASMGDTLVYDHHTPGGYTFQDHWSGLDPCFIQIKTKSWDYIVMQEQSQMPALGQYLAMPNHPTYTYATQFTNLIRDSAKCTTPIFYMTWGYKDGDAANCPWQASMCTYLSMDSILRARYLELADSFDAVVSPAGAVRRYIRANHPGIELYTADGGHPSVEGSYAVACAFYTSLFKKDPTQVTFNSTVAAADAANIRAAAKKVVYDSLAYWGLGMYDLAAAFDHSGPGAVVSFINKSSLKAQTYSWNFGDGNTSTLKNPVHNYSNFGSYTVTLTAYDANGCSRMISKKVNVLDPIGIDDVTNTSFTILPNPAAEYITITPAQQSTRFDIRIINAMGQTVYAAPGSASANKVDLSAFGSGMYYITLYNETGVLHNDKFVKQ